MAIFGPLVWLFSPVPLTGYTGNETPRRSIDRAKTRTVHAIAPNLHWRRYLSTGCEPKCDFSQAPTGGRGSCRAENTCTRLQPSTRLGRSLALPEALPFRNHTLGFLFLAKTLTNRTLVHTPFDSLACLCKPAFAILRPEPGRNGGERRAFPINSNAQKAAESLLPKARKFWRPSQYPSLHPSLPWRLLFFPVGYLPAGPAVDLSVGLSGWQAAQHW
uniref:Uncharacterized protein n=1 Tax=Candidatus Kentrum sp. FM TaxID=2126340 RepID=A0A450SF78_9GAMM|nr:MAG: hypothetical protein BECKFM1743C_GA0114222_100974 [Candidatus Kentron sp. FM]VFK08390.1 MAG: hypothetical protein BECKFM1743B_GA0114221_100686 [Candidatus Kentron sp. FM]